jgi:hypothetical protein
MEPHRPKGQASLFDLGCTKRKRTEDDGPARELIRLRPDVQQGCSHCSQHCILPCPS